MNYRHPFTHADLAEFDERLLSRAEAVVSIRDSIGANNQTIGMRHDVDNELAPAVAMAAWEAARGYQATYYILHSAPYWDNKYRLQSALASIAGNGHEIGFHTNAIATALRTGRDPVEIIEEAVAELRGYGYDITGVVAHGDNLCREVEGGFVNDEIFAECVRPAYGDHGRVVEHNGVRVDLGDRVPRARFGFEYDPNWLHRAHSLSDSGGWWQSPFDEAADAFPYESGQLHILQHPCWWRSAFVAQEIAA
jgi:hypothetical protein